MKTKITLLALLISLNLLAKEFTGSVSLGQLNVIVNINDETNKVRIDLRGPLNSWFSVGFGSTQMNNTYAIIANENFVGSVSERILGNWSYGRSIKSSIRVNNFGSSGILASYSIERPLVVTNGGYNFTAQSGSIDVILAIGPNTTPQTYHGGFRTSTKLTLTEVLPTSTNTDVNKKYFNAFPNPTNSILNIEWSEIAESTAIKVCAVDGKIVQELVVENLKNYALDVSGLKQGTYFLIVQNKEWNSNFTFIKD